MTTLYFTDGLGHPRGWVEIDAADDVVRTSPNFAFMKGYHEDGVRGYALMRNFNLMEIPNETRSSV